MGQVTKRVYGYNTNQKELTRMNLILVLFLAVATQGHLTSEKTWSEEIQRWKDVRESDLIKGIAKFIVPKMVNAGSRGEEEFLTKMVMKYVGYCLLTPDPTTCSLCMKPECNECMTVISQATESELGWMDYVQACREDLPSQALSDEQLAKLAETEEDSADSA